MNFFCDFPSQDEHTTVNILRVLLRQLIERANGETLTSLKDFWEESNVPKSATDIVKSIMKAGSQQKIYLLLDAVDEMKSSDEVLRHCVDLSNFGIQVLISSQNIPHIEKNMSTADQLAILGNSRDLKLYIEHRMQECGFKDDLAGDDAIIDNIISKSGKS